MRAVRALQTVALVPGGLGAAQTGFRVQLLGTGQEHCSLVGPLLNSTSYCGVVRSDIIALTTRVQVPDVQRNVVQQPSWPKNTKNAFSPPVLLNYYVGDRIFFFAVLSINQSQRLVFCELSRFP